jgi:hypothetical protein
MDNDQQMQVVEDRLDVLERMPADDDRSARDALTYLMTTVIRMDQLTSKVQAQAMMGAGAPVDEIMDRLRKWVDRLVTALRRIIAKLAGARSFSVSVNTTVSVAVEFGPSGSGPG